MPAIPTVSTHSYRFSNVRERQSPSSSTATTSSFTFPRDASDSLRSSSCSSQRTSPDSLPGSVPVNTIPKPSLVNWQDEAALETAVDHHQGDLHSSRDFHQGCPYLPRLQSIPAHASKGPLPLFPYQAQAKPAYQPGFDDLQSLATPSITSASSSTSVPNRSFPTMYGSSSYLQPAAYDRRFESQSLAVGRVRQTSQTVSDRPAKSTKFSHPIHASREGKGGDVSLIASGIRPSIPSTRYDHHFPINNQPSTSRRTMSLDAQNRHLQALPICTCQLHGPFVENDQPAVSATSQAVVQEELDVVSGASDLLATTPLLPTDSEHHEAALRLASFATLGKQHQLQHHHPPYMKSVTTAEVGTCTDEDWLDGEMPVIERGKMPALASSSRNSQTAVQDTAYVGPVGQGIGGSSLRAPPLQLTEQTQHHNDVNEGSQISSDSGDMQAQSIHSNGSAGGGNAAPSGSGKYACDLCHRRFTRPSALAVHTHMHTGAKPFTCAVCLRGFSVNSNLRRHLRTHSKAEKDAAGVQS